MHLGAEIRGDRTGRVWEYYPAVDRLSAPGSGERFRITATDDDSLALLHRCPREGMWLDDVDRLELAIHVAGLPTITAEPAIRQLLDVRDEPPTPEPFAYAGSLAAIWEWGTIPLNEYLQDPPVDFEEVAAEVECNVTAALMAIHGAGYVHCDVAPNNVLLVRHEWKLADLDACVPIGELALRQPMNSRYVHPERRGDVPPAREEFDFYGLDQVLARIREAAISA